MIITLNIVSKYVNIGLSKSMESYLKYTFSKQILVFAIAWMGTRDIYIALTLTIIFIILFDFSNVTQVSSSKQKLFFYYFERHDN